MKFTLSISSMGVDVYAAIEAALAEAACMELEIEFCTSMFTSSDDPTGTTLDVQAQIVIKAPDNSLTAILLIARLEEVLKPFSANLELIPESHGSHIQQELDAATTFHVPQHATHRLPNDGVVGPESWKAVGQTGGSFTPHSASALIESVPDFSGHTPGTLPTDGARIQAAVTAAQAAGFDPAPYPQSRGEDAERRLQHFAPDATVSQLRQRPECPSA